MKTVLDLSHIEAKKFFLNERRYFSLDLPEYFSFQKLIDKIENQLNGKELKEVGSNIKIRDVENVNYTFFSNKDGKLAYRPFQLIHPVVYISLVNNITQKDNWQKIINRFLDFRNNPNITCNSIPVAEENSQLDKQNQIYEWWDHVEQESLRLSLDYNHVIHLDLTDCYGSIYSHSIPWALLKKDEAKKKENRSNEQCIGYIIDKHIQDMSYGQTNGIPQGSILMDFIAEFVLGYADELLSEKLKQLNINNYRIIRYRDDYRIFTKNAEVSNIIAKELSEILSGLNFRINSSKTISTNDIVLGSLKPDKAHWIYNKRKTENVQKWLIQLYMLGEKFPNSGMLYKELKKFVEWLENKENKSKKRTESESSEVYRIQRPDVLISVLIGIAFNNPKTYPIVIGALSFLIPKVGEIRQQKELIERIKEKFSQLPNTSYLDVWLQRLTLKIDDAIEYESKFCKKVKNPELPIWNSTWLNKGVSNLVNSTSVINNEILNEIEINFSKSETENLGRNDKMMS